MMSEVESEANFCIALVLNSSHGDLIIFDFSVRVKSLFWLISSIKENLPNNSAHLNIWSFSIPAFMDNYLSLINY